MHAVHERNDMIVSDDASSCYPLASCTVLCDELAMLDGQIELKNKNEFGFVFMSVNLNALLLMS